MFTPAQLRVTIATIEFQSGVRLCKKGGGIFLPNRFNSICTMIKTASMSPQHTNTLVSLSSSPTSIRVLAITDWPPFSAVSF